MKKQALTLIGVLSLLLAAGSAFAQTIHVRANIPFNFIVDKGTLPTGEYELRTLNDGDARILVLYDPDGRPKMMISSQSVESLKASASTKLVFNRYGDRYFLKQVWVEGQNAGRQLPKSPREQEVAMDYSADSVVVLAEVR